MPPSIPVQSSFSDPKNIPYGNYMSFPWTEFPEYGGKKSIMYRSADGKVVAGTAHETGSATLTYPCDEFFFVTDGWIKLSIQNGDSFTMTKGDYIYIKKGTTIDFEFGPEFYNVAVFINDEKIGLI